ncbi:MAG: hypothetical protein AAF957_08260 [Planctomycetota bacterium]
MRRHHRRSLSLLVLGPLSAIAPPIAHAQSPCADARALLDAVSAPRAGKRILFTGGFGAFFPADSHNDGSAKSRQSFRCQMTLDRAGEEVGRWPLLVQGEGKVFQRFQAFGGSPIHELTEGGEYVLSVEFDGDDVTSVPFRVEARTSGDPFDPATTYVVDSDLGRWAQIVVSHASARPTVSVAFRLRGEDLGLAEGDDLDLTVERRGRVVYDGGRLGAITDASGSRTYTKQLRYPDTQGGAFLPLDDFTKVDGTYRVVLRSGGEAVRAWDYVVENGALRPHARSSFEHAPRSDYLLSRVCLPENGGHEDLVWLEPVVDPAADPVFDTGALRAVAASAATRALWKPTTPAPERSPRVVVTEVAARVDAHIAAGDGVVAYGTGPVSGVAFLRCEDGVERSIPDGASFSSTAFFVCGRKIVLVERTEIAVHDTESGTLTRIPAEDVSLARTPSDPLKGAPIAADRNLVAVLCSPDEVGDRRVVKVIDLSGDSPRIIDLGFPDATPRELSSIAVDASGGTVVIGSDRKHCLFVAPIAEDADFVSIDLSQHDGFTKNCAPIVRAGVAAVFDATGTRKLRLVDLQSGSVRTLCGLGKSLRYFDFDGERVALASDVSYGSSFEVRVGPVDGQPTAPAGAGESARHGKVGYAQRVALTAEGLVFASGDGRSGISRDEVLLVTDGASWHEVRGGDGPLPAVDVTLGEHVIAFKTGKSRDARVGYVLLGRGMVADGLGVDG